MRVSFLHPWFSAAVLIFGSTSVASEVETELFSPRVTHAEGSYYVEMAARLPIPRDVLFDAVTNYDHLELISESIVSSRYVGELENGTKEIHVRLKLCVMWLVCPGFRQVQEVVESKPTNLDAAIPKRGGNLFIGSAHWDFESVGDHSILKFHSTLTPQFWVPPWVGTALVERALTRESERVLTGLESLYRNEKSASR